MKTLAAWIATYLLLTGLSMAQNVSSPETGDTSQSLVAAAKASRNEVRLKKAKEDDIRHLLEVTGAAAIATQSMDEMEKSMKPLIANALPPGEYRDQLVNLFFEKFRANRDPQQLVELIVPIYERYYSDDEIKGLIQLYQTPLGQKMLSVLPKVAAESQAAGAQWGQQIGRETMMQVLAEHPELQRAMEEAAKNSQSH